MATIGMVSTRFSGLDGVTLEAHKVAVVLQEAGHDVVWFAGLLGERFHPGHQVPAAHFDTDQNRKLQSACFGSATTPAEVRRTLEQRTQSLAEALRRFIAEFSVDVLMPQNSNAIPMQLPLGAATARVVEATGIHALAHHHDFGWERPRFAVSGVGDVLEYAFPPRLPSMRHITINSLAASALLERRGIQSAVLPNVMDFANPPPPGSGRRFRRHANVGEQDTLIIQPTRLVPRKSIEDAITLAARLGDTNVKVRVTHPEQDEGGHYTARLEETAARSGVDFAVTPVDEAVGATLADAYAAADLVTYPSRIEGFGNALLEAWYFKAPLLVNRYPVYVADIAPKAPTCIEMDGALTDRVVDEAAEWLADPSIGAGAAEHNFDVGRRWFSYDRIRQTVLPLLAP